MHDTPKKRPPRFILAMPDELRREIERAAISVGRTVTAEINLRLQRSLDMDVVEASHIRPAGGEAAPGAENGLMLSATDHAMLAVFHKLPVEKQLALLSLFK